MEPRGQGMHSGYTGEPGDPSPMTGHSEARVFADVCNLPITEIVNPAQTIWHTAQICGQRKRLTQGAYYACPRCDATDQWPARDCE